VCACVRACVRACVCVCVYARAHKREEGSGKMERGFAFLRAVSERARLACV